MANAKMSHGIPERVGMFISGHKTDSVYRRYSIIDMEVMKAASAKIEEHQREVVKAENSHRTATVSSKDGTAKTAQVTTREK